MSNENSNGNGTIPDDLKEILKGMSPDDLKKILKMSPDDLEKILKESELKATLDRIKWTFWSILIFNYVLISMGVAAFVMAIVSAAGGEFDVAAVFSFLGTVDVISVFKFSMDRVQRSLGDQVQVETAKCGIINQMDFVRKLGSKPNVPIQAIEKINAEIRRATLDTMKLIQDFTKIAEPLKKKSWLRARERAYHLRYELEFPSKVYVGNEITASGTIRNTGDEPITLTSIVIAVRPPFGTVDSGPFMFDFWIFPRHTLDPGESHPVTKTKCIEDSARREGKEDIKKEYYGRGWFAFIACQTEDGEWHNDPSKTFFEVLEKKQ